MPSSLSLESAKKILEKSDICIQPADVLARLLAFTGFLARWNRQTNLVGPREPEAIFRELVLDSLHLAPFLAASPLPAAPLAFDLGAGAGIPGIPLRLLWQAGTYCLVEPREKRALFMRAAVAQLTLPRLSVHQMEARQFMRQQASAGQRPDLIVSRAFLPWPALLECVGPWLAPGGQVVILASEAPPASFQNGWTCSRAHSYPVEGKTRWFWLVRPAGTGA